ncbi:hypothetical protein DFH06DRAFT_1128149 [Mycena polygramma]|nr:hypothetical protein DFH06DRAFT_1128149 [Mycena polygramma]
MSVAEERRDGWERSTPRRRGDGCLSLVSCHALLVAPSFAPPTLPLWVRLPHRIRAQLQATLLVLKRNNADALTCVSPTNSDLCLGSASTVFGTLERTHRWKECCRRLATAGYGWLGSAKPSEPLRPGARGLQTEANEDSNRSYRAYSQDWILKRPSYSQIPNAKSQMPRLILYRRVLRQPLKYTPYTRLVGSVRFTITPVESGVRESPQGACKCIFNSERNYLNRVVLGVKSRLNPYVKEGRAGVAPQ